MGSIGRSSVSFIDKFHYVLRNELNFKFRSASGDVIVFMDCHTEANVNWLPPLIEPIAKDYRTCVCPVSNFTSLLASKIEFYHKLNVKSYLSHFLLSKVHRRH